MKKKALSVLLALAMGASLLTGCGSSPAPTGNDASSSQAESKTESKSEESSAADTGSAGEEAPDLTEEVTLKWYLHGSDVKDDKAVIDKANEYLKEKLNVKLQPIWGTWGDFDQNAVLALQGGDDIDIYFTCSWSQDEYNKFAKDGYWVRLDDPDNNLLEKYAKETWDLLPDLLTEGAKINGSDGVGIYAIPGYKDYATQNCWDVNVPLLEKYGFTLDDIKNRSYYELGEVLQKVKEGEGQDFYPLLVEGAVFERMITNSIITTGDSTQAALLSYYLDPTDVSKPGSGGLTIQNKYATEEYKKYAEKTREYFEAGYIDPVMANTSQANDKRTASMKDGAYLLNTQSYSLGYDIQASAERKFEVAMVPLTDAYVDTTATQGAMMAVSTSSRNPERAVMFLNLLNSDPYLMTLLNYGIEGVHYELNGDGEAVFLPERDNYKPWTNGMGNITQLPPQEGQGANFYEEYKEYYATSKAIPILGYSFDVTPVEVEMANCVQVASEFAMALNVGFVDPATELPKFLQKLEDAGMQTVVDEANRQLEEFLSLKE